MLKTFKKLSTATTYAEGQPIVRVTHRGESVYVVGIGSTSEMAVLTPTDRGSYGVAGHVTARHLDRLGNANWAKAERPYAFTAFEPQ